jgi:cyclopropane-fatty-acyl-phospholipid synthase
VAQALCHRVVQDLPVRLRYPDGTEVGGGDGESPVVELVRPVAAFERMAASPKIGIGAAYMAGDWRAADGTDLADLLTPFAEHLPTILPRPLMRLRRFLDRTIPSSQANTPTGSRRNIAAHYDLSNDLFALFLDPTLSYSSALFDDARPWDEQDLAEAQRRKVDAVLDRAGVRGGTRLLEIGTGWGELALRAARRGAHVTTITLSVEQADLARARVAEAGLADRVDIRLEDYRSVEGSYDAVVSVEMIEAVGEEFWPTYFQAIDRLLAPGGRAAVQAILMDHEQLRATRHSYGWIQKYIFPGGLIPSVRAMDEVTRRHTDLRLTGAHAFGPHYAETLRRWRQVFLESWPAVATLGFDETFRRMWEFYLAYSEAGFASGYLDVAQLTLARDGD